jgi:RNA polymerase sigma-70 factor (ECF subfamily)
VKPLSINQRHESRIYGFIYSKISDETFQMIFSRYFYQIKTLKSNSYNEEKFFTLGMRISHNLIDHLKKQENASI